MVNALAAIAKQFDRDVVMPLREQAIGRKLIPRNNNLSGLGIGGQSYDHYTFSDLSAAMIDYQLPENDIDTVDLTATTTKMVYMAKGYRIPRTAYESYVLKGMRMDSDAAVAVADLIAVAENTLFIQGWKPDGTNYKVPGLYNATGVNTEATGAAFSTYGNAIIKVTLAMAQLQADNVYGPYNLVLNQTQYNELLASESTSGLPEWDRVQRLINVNSGGNVGQIYVTSALADGYGMLTGIGSKYFDFIEGQPLKNELGIDSAHPDTGPIIGTLYEAVVPRIKMPAAVCTLTSI